MRFTTIRILAATALILMMVLIMSGTERESENEENSNPVSSSFSVPPLLDETRHETRQRRRNAISTSDDSRAGQLIELKKRWLSLNDRALDHHSTDYMILRNQLSTESARLLLCTEESIELIQFLEREQVINLVESKVIDLFDTDLAEEARQTLISLPKTTSFDETDYRQLWSGPAGKGCTPEEFREFCAALGDSASVQEAVFGQNVALAKTDPIGALTSTVNQIDAGLDSVRKSSSIKNLLEALPAETDFEQVDNILLSTSRAEDSLSPFVGVRSHFVRAWSKADPAAAVNYLIEHPDRFPVSDIHIPVSQILSQDLTKGIEWIQTFPDGPHFDAAVNSAVTMLIDRGNPKEAHQLASQIGNPDSRRAVMNAALRPPRSYSESESD